jgi:hypothetical protein
VRSSLNCLIHFLASSRDPDAGDARYADQNRATPHIAHG